jgi:predicted SAM-dependent methyltransferase
MRSGLDEVLARERAVNETSVRRLNWGCGSSPKPGWINSDRRPCAGVDVVGDILAGLPLAEDSIDYAVSVHALQEISYRDLVPALRELRRLLRPGGVLRLVLPDLDKGIRSYLEKAKDRFMIPDEEAKSLGGKFIVHMLWYGYSRVLFTHDFVEELLLKAGFARVSHCQYRETVSPFAGIVELDNRAGESLFVEAVK